jgi:hypothetical protein
MIDKFRKIAAGNRIRELFIVILVFACIGSNLWKDWLYKQQTLVCVVNGDTSYIGWADPLEEAKEYHRFLAREAIDAIFDRTPDGYSRWERAVRILNTPVQNSLLKDKAKDDEVFRTFKITQSFSDFKAQEIPIDGHSFTMMIRGNIIRNLIRDGEGKVETTPVRVILRLIPDEHWEVKGKFAMVVSQLQVDPI